MKDLGLELEDRPGALADLGEALARTGISIEGGGAFAANGTGIAHFLVADGEAARAALERSGIRVREVNEVLVQRLRQDEPGELGRFARQMAAAGVNIRVLYSDHQHQLILVVDDVARGRRVSEEWMRHRRE